MGNEEQQRMLELARQESWIKTPFSYTRLGKKLTLLQQDAMLMVSDHLQKYIKDFYDLHLDRSKNKPRSLFAKHLLQNGIPGFKIYLADLGIITANYKVTREAIEEMNLLVEHPELDKDGVPTGATVFSPVFKRFRVPATGDLYKKTDEQGEVIIEAARHYGYIEVEINNEVAQWAFDMSQGYLTHPKLIARYASKRSTPRLYFYLLHKMGKERRTTVNCSVSELKDFLGFEAYKDEETGEWVTPYAQFAHFKTKVLDAVKKDLEDMAELNHTDIIFDYRPVYKNGRKRGDPDFIEFSIKSTDLGRAYSILTGISTPATDEAKAKEQAVQQDLFAREQENEAMWQKVMDVMTKQTPLTDNDIKFESYDNETQQLIVQIARRELFGVIDQEDGQQPGEYMKIWITAVRNAFGSKVHINYRLPAK